VYILCVKCHLACIFVHLVCVCVHLVSRACGFGYLEFNTKISISIAVIYVNLTVGWVVCYACHVRGEIEN